MPEPGQAPTVENQLAEMDRRLSELQAELAPEVEQAAEAQRAQASADPEFAADSEPAAETAHVEGSEPAVQAASPVESEVAASETTPPVPEPEPIREPPPQPPPPSPQPPPAPPQPPPVSAPDEARGRTGPLSTLLQRSSRRDVSAQQVETLAVLSEGLLASLRELLAGYELVVGQMRPEGATPSRSLLGAEPLRAQAAHPQELTLSAGPFHSTVALREFQRAITTLPGVREVAVREYEGADRAILHVQLDQGTA